MTNRGGRTCHAAIVAREAGLPAVVGCGDATSALVTGTLVTVCCSEGDTGHVYDGELDFSTTRVDVAALERPSRVKVRSLAAPLACHPLRRETRLPCYEHSRGSRGGGSTLAASPVVCSLLPSIPSCASS